ncbi:hypothetical protein HOP60_09965 [Halomonas daqingensis]|uniref:Uncharacterized protein n=1 Tax=Billgrantia desiderata TaxID=52021 RepID=A0ABS9B5J6_9GAMM|nr:hypothetical protein [Halomonas desiderata]MCE8042479.1 hypothetical protein [Halomonas desiderata]MCE8047054.1 hypothetical protein [Halomonas desiderata]
MIWLLGISAYLSLVAFVFAACKVAGDYDRELLGEDDMYCEHGIYDDATVFTYAVREIAAAWREHAERNGVTDPAVHLLAREAEHGTPGAGYRPAFYVPSTGYLVVIIAVPHPTEQAAINWMEWMLEQLHNNGSITLYPRNHADQAPAQERIA